VRELIIDVLRYWVAEMHVDGFRVIDPPHERAMRNQRLNPRRLVGGKFHEPIPGDDQDEPISQQIGCSHLRGGTVIDAPPITIDGSEANAAAIRTSNQEHGTTITIRQVKYVNHLVEQDHRSVKRVTRPMWGFKSFDAAQSTLIGIELMHMLRKGQLEDEVAQDLTPAEQFYS
jgi:DDE domain